ncbi:hypothetical protein KCP76_02755 [Salmonella enterica subsp. enterica serovar Weltevreden]|nr:hypothetical protein KCP76_02755 [Salmonella enterica subsp. enterica serovar Weltevreden]
MPKHSNLSGNNKEPNPRRLPGIIQSFDPDAVTAVAQPAIRSLRPDNDGNFKTKTYPLLVDVPVVFRGGGRTLTFPVKAGDECLRFFRSPHRFLVAERRVQSLSTTAHDLSDAFCIVGPQSQAQKISGISTGPRAAPEATTEVRSEPNPSTHRKLNRSARGLDI